MSISEREQCSKLDNSSDKKDILVKDYIPTMDVLLKKYTKKKCKRRQDLWK